MIALVKNPEKKIIRQINQKGLNVMFFRMVEQAGGKLNFPCASLNLPIGSILHITYDDKTDSFNVETAVVEQKTIIQPERKLVIPK